VTAHRALTVVLYGVTLAGVFTLALSSFTYFDFWWYLKSGELIVSTQSIPATDPFSFTAQGRPWINHMWATQVLFFALWKIGGRLPLILLKAGVVTATFAIVLLTMRRRGVLPILASAITLLLAWAGREFWDARPQIFTYLLLGLFLWLLREGWEGRRWNLIALPLLMVAWANLHAGFVTGIAVVGLVGVGSALPRLLDPEHRREGWRTLGLAARLLVLVTLASLVNPFGVRALLFPVEVVNTRAFMVTTHEWFSPNFHNPVYRGFEATVLLLIPAFAWGRARLTTTDVVVSLTFLHLALASVRHIPLFLIAVAAPLADSLGAGVRALWACRANGWQILERLRPRLPTLWPLALAPVTHVAAAVCFVSLAVTMAWGTFLHPASSPLLQDLNERRYPEQTMAFIKRERLPGPLFNDYAWGGYELWRLYPDYQVFMDGRTHVYGRDVLRDFLEVTSVGTRWHAVLDKWKIQTILVPPRSSLARTLQTVGGWRPVFAEREAVVFLREAEANRELLSRHPAVTLSGLSPDVAEALSQALRAAEAGDDERAIGRYREVLALEPDHLVALFSLGVLQERRGEVVQARALFDRVRGLEPDSELARQARERLGRLR